jgi:sulfur carrier protein ThiS
MNIKVHYRDNNLKKVDDLISIPDSTTVKELLAQVGLPRMMAVVNGKMARPDSPLQENDDVYLFDQMTGG